MSQTKESVRCRIENTVFIISNKLFIKFLQIIEITFFMDNKKNGFFTSYFNNNFSTQKFLKFFHRTIL